jgi:hypothetical protein
MAPFFTVPFFAAPFFTKTVFTAPFLTAPFFSAAAVFTAAVFTVPFFKAPFLAAPFFAAVTGCGFRATDLATVFRAATGRRGDLRTAVLRLALTGRFLLTERLFMEQL